MKRAITFIALVWFLAVLVVLSSGCQQKAGREVASSDAVLDVSPSHASGYQQQAPVAPQPVVYDTPSAPAPAPAPMGMDDNSLAGGAYTVQKGDTLYGIARQRYGDGKQWTRIAEANPGLRPETLRAGQTINLP